MRLKIEPPEATRESYSGAPGRSGASSCVLDLVIEPQEFPKWCWAAIAASLGRYYRTAERSQRQVATDLLGFDCSRLPDTPAGRERCDLYAMLDEALALVGCFSHWSPGRPTFERIRAEIDAGRPVCVQIDWSRNGAHFAVITGYHADRREIHLEDPLHGPSVQQYERFPGAYRSSGVWRGTYWTLTEGSRRTDHVREPERELLPEPEHPDARSGASRGASHGTSRGAPNDDPSDATRDTQGDRAINRDSSPTTRR